LRPAAPVRLLEGPLGGIDALPLERVQLTPESRLGLLAGPLLRLARESSPPCLQPASARFAARSASARRCASARTRCSASRIPVSASRWASVLAFTAAWRPGSRPVA
jgi:hypothetical protein